MRKRRSEKGKGGFADGGEGGFAIEGDFDREGGIECEGVGVDRDGDLTLRQRERA